MGRLHTEPSLQQEEPLLQADTEHRGLSCPAQVPPCWEVVSSLLQLPDTQLHSVQLELLAGLSEMQSNTNIIVQNILTL